MRHFRLFVFFVFALLSCSHEEGERPDIKKDILVDVLVDIHLTDGYLSYTGSRIDRDRESIEDAYNFVFQKYNITPKQFDNTMKYYSRHIDEYEKVYNKVIEILTKYETENLNAADGSPKRAEVRKKRLKSEYKKRYQKS